MRVAFVGKGGAGKSAIAGTFARSLARRGTSVLALDTDPLPGLAFSLGLPSTDAPIPEEATEEKAEGEDGPRWRLRSDLTPVEAVERYAATAPDGVRFLQFGKVRRQWTAPEVRSQFVFRQIVHFLPEEPWSLVGDLPGGTRQAFGGWGGFARTMLVVVDPSAKSLLSARRLARLASIGEDPPRVVAVVNRVRQDDDEALVARRSGLDVVGAVPWDEEFADAERRGLAPIDAAPNCPAVKAVESLVDRLCEESRA